MDNMTKGIQDQQIQKEKPESKTQNFKSLRNIFEKFLGINEWDGRTYKVFPNSMQEEYKLIKKILATKEPENIMVKTESGKIPLHVYIIKSAASILHGYENHIQYYVGMSSVSKITENELSDIQKRDDELAAVSMRILNVLREAGVDVSISENDLSERETKFVRSHEYLSNIIFSSKESQCPTTEVAGL